MQGAPITLFCCLNGQAEGVVQAGGRASPRAARTCPDPRAYFRPRLQCVVGFVNNPAAAGRGRDPSRGSAFVHLWLSALPVFAFPRSVFT